MKRIKNQGMNGYNLFLTMLLALLGCSGEEQACEYGTPRANFVVKGTIRSKSNAQPVSHVKVKLFDSDMNLSDSVISDQNGSFEVDIEDFPMSQELPIKFTDVDGTANGLFLPKDTVVEFKDPSFTGGDGNWNQGETQKVFDIKLIPGNDGQ